MPKALPGYSGGNLPGRSKLEEGREEGEKEQNRSQDGERVDDCNPSQRAKANSRSRRLDHSESSVCGPQHEGRKGSFQ